MKWTEDKVSQLKELCFSGVSNKEIAATLGCTLEQIYAKRSQLEITIDKCKMGKVDKGAVKKLYGLHIKNQTDKKIDLCVGLNGEFTLFPADEMTVGVQDGDYFYIDQVIEARRKNRKKEEQ